MKLVEGEQGDTDGPLRIILQAVRQRMPPGTLCSEKEATRSRLGELHRLLNNRKGQPQSDVQEECRSERQGLRLEPEDNTGSGFIGGGTHCHRSHSEKGNIRT